VNAFIGGGIDPRQYSDCIELMKDFIKPESIKKINHDQNTEIKNKINIIL
jgi:hypothetical protein